MAKQTTEQTAKKFPDFHAYVVTKKDAKDKGFWTKIGAAWRHPDGEGINLQLIALPTDGQIVLRVPKAESEG